MKFASKTAALALIAVSFALTGCATNNEPYDGPSVKEFRANYNASMNRWNSLDNQARRESAMPNRVSETRGQTGR